MDLYTPLFNYKRIKTPIVNIGNISMGDNYPIRIQSMTNTNTSDIEATVLQCKKIFDAGADFVRITVPSIKDIENFKKIKEKLSEAGYTKPLIADIHFNYKIAYEVAKIAEKIRINPGNFLPPIIDKNKSIEIQIEEKFVPLIKICKEYNTAIRIGVNHGSLPSHILEKLGDTPEGMVETVMQFLRICKNYNFYNVVVSMKSSNPLIMVLSNRLLINKMYEEDVVFPIHIGVTEAGEGEEGRIKSAIGTGCLLLDGIGDTIRISLTESPEKEIPVAKMIINYVEEKKSLQMSPIIPTIPHNPFGYKKINTYPIKDFGGKNPFRVLLNIKNVTHYKSFNSDFTPDAFFIENLENIEILKEFSNYKKPFFIYQSLLRENSLPLNNDYIIPLFSVAEFLQNNIDPSSINSLLLSVRDVNNTLIKKLKKHSNTIIIVDNDDTTDIYGQRALIYHLINNKIYNPIILKRKYNNINSLEELKIKASIDYSIFLIDGFLDGMLIDVNDNISSHDILDTSFGILQASKRRITKAEFISCPTCGRTHFNIIEVIKSIKEKTGHLKGIKIAVMGCSVNGPGEMADADYGYVGAGPGKVNLYKGKKIVKKNVPENEALNELINLIKLNGDWIDRSDN